MNTTHTPTTHHERVLAFLKRRPKEISELAKEVELTETQVRHAIGVARARGFNIQRDSLRRFKNLGKKVH